MSVNAGSAIWLPLTQGIYDTDGLCVEIIRVLATVGVTGNYVITNNRMTLTTDIAIRFIKFNDYRD